MRYYVFDWTAGKHHGRRYIAVEHKAEAHARLFAGIARITSAKPHITLKMVMPY